MKSKVSVLVTDGERALIVQRPGKLPFLPNESLWPAGRRPKRQNWALAILMHSTYAPFTKVHDWPLLEKQKRAFGVSTDTSWYLCTVSAEYLDAVVDKSKAAKMWWFRYGDAKPPWTLKIVNLVSMKDECDAKSAHISLAFLHK